MKKNNFAKELEKEINQIGEEQKKDKKNVSNKKSEKNKSKLKSTDAEIMVRVNKIYNLLLNGFSRSDIIQYITEKTEYKVTERQIDNYIFKAREILYEESKESQSQWLAKASKKLEDLYKKNMSTKDFRECRRLLLAANKILGYEKLSLELTGLKSKPIIIDYSNLTEEEAKRLVEEKLSEVDRI